jgi:hypothetical protein
MTWSSQVSSHSSSVKASGLEADGPLGRQTTIVNTQCHMTTTSRLKARTRSMNSSLEDGRAGAAPWVGGDVGGVAMVHSSMDREVP